MTLLITNARNRVLAAAFLDEAAVPALEKFPRWKKLKPLDPKRVNVDGSVSPENLL